MKRLALLVLFVASCKSSYGDAAAPADAGTDASSPSALADDDDAVADRDASTGTSGEASTTFTQCTGSYVYCNDFETSDSLSKLTPWGTNDGTVTLEPATGPTAGQVAHFAVTKDEHDMAFQVPVDITSVRLEALVRVTNPANAEKMMLFAMLDSTEKSGAQVWVANDTFTLSPYDGSSTPGILISAQTVTSDWFLFRIETTVENGYGEAVLPYLNPDAGGASSSFGNPIHPPLHFVFGLFGEYGNALGDTAIDVDWVKVTAL